MNSSSTYTKPQIVIRKNFNHPVEKVWQALTDPDALSTWLMETRGFSLDHGAQFQFRTTPRGKFDGIVDCEIHYVDQPHTLQYSWKAKGMKQPTMVTWQLKRLNDSKTSLTLSHNGFVGVDGWFTKTMLNFGWKKLLNKKLRTFLSR